MTLDSCKLLETSKKVPAFNIHTHHSRIPNYELYDYSFLCGDPFFR
jgi:hypothetical protein